MAFTNTAQQSTNRGARLPPALSPENPALVQPYRDFIARGWITELTLKVTPGSVAIVCKLGKAVEVPEGTDRNSLTPQQAKSFIEDAKLWSPGGKQKSGAKKEEVKLPKRSLCKEDFSGTDANLLNRIRSVAKDIGDNTARGRIGSLKIFKEGCDSFDKWWEKAGPREIGHLLTSKAYFEKLSDADFVRIKSVCEKSPFRGSNLPLPEKAKEGKEDQDESDEEPVKPPTPVRKPAAAPAPAPPAQKAKGNGSPSKK